MLIEFDETAATASEAVDRLQELDRLLSRLQAIQADLLVTAASPDLAITGGQDIRARPTTPGRMRSRPARS